MRKQRDMRLYAVDCALLPVYLCRGVQRYHLRKPVFYMRISWKLCRHSQMQGILYVLIAFFGELYVCFQDVPESGACSVPMGHDEPSDVSESECCSTSTRMPIEEITRGRRGLGSCFLIQLKRSWLLLDKIEEGLICRARRWAQNM